MQVRAYRANRMHFRSVLNAKMVDIEAFRERQSIIGYLLRINDAE